MKVQGTPPQLAGGTFGRLEWRETTNVANLDFTTTMTIGTATFASIRQNRVAARDRRRAAADLRRDGPAACLAG